MEQAARDLDLDLSRSYLVGDRYSDIQTAANAGVKGILVLTGYGRGEYEYVRAAQNGAAGPGGARSPGSGGVDFAGFGREILA